MTIDDTPDELRRLVAERKQSLVSVKVMPPDCYRELRFPGYEGWNAMWDIHASGPFVYIPLCAEFPEARSVVMFRYDTRNGQRERLFDADAAAGIDLSTGIMPQSKFHTAIQTMQDGRLFMVTHNTAAGIYHPTWSLNSLWHDPLGFSSRAFIYDPERNLTTYVGTPVPNEDLYFGRLDAELGNYYACGYRIGALYIIDSATLEATEVASQCAREGAMSRRWESSSDRFADRAVVERNCVCESRGGEQRETKVTSAR